MFELFDVHWKGVTTYVYTTGSYLPVLLTEKKKKKVRLRNTAYGQAPKLQCYLKYMRETDSHLNSFKT